MARFTRSAAACMRNGDLDSAGMAPSIRDLPGPFSPRAPADPAHAPAFGFQEQRVAGSVLKFRAVRVNGDAPLSWREVLQLWAESNNPFLSAFRRTLECCPFEDFFLECRPVSDRTADEPFEFVLIDAHGDLQHRQQQVSCDQFKEHLDTAHAHHKLATDFVNLRRDARLVVPTRLTRTCRHVYGHIACFTRGADWAQQVELWRMVSSAVEAALRSSPHAMLWLNTDGTGVPWLHVRLDQQPKYIKHHPYRAWEAGRGGYTPRQQPLQPHTHMLCDVQSIDPPVTGLSSARSRRGAHRDVRPPAPCDGQLSTERDMLNSNRDMVDLKQLQSLQSQWPRPAEQETGPREGGPRSGVYTVYHPPTLQPPLPALVALYFVRG